MISCLHIRTIQITHSHLIDQEKVQASDQLQLEIKQQSKELSVQLKSVTHEKYEAEKKLAVLESKQMGKK